MVAAYAVLRFDDIREATRLLLAWNVGAWAFLILILTMVMDQKRDASVQSRPEDENQWVLVVLGIAAALAAIAAIVWELGPVKDMSGWPKAGHLALVAAARADRVTKAQAEIMAESCAGHSPRAGHATSAAHNDAPGHAIQRQLRDMR